jgi:hypothetical protein
MPAIPHHLVPFLRAVRACLYLLTTVGMTPEQFNMIKTATGKLID